MWEDPTDPDPSPWWAVLYVALFVAGAVLVAITW